MFSIVGLRAEREREGGSRVALEVAIVRVFVGVARCACLGDTHIVSVSRERERERERVWFITDGVLFISEQCMRICLHNCVCVCVNE